MGESSSYKQKSISFEMLSVIRLGLALGSLETLS